MVEIFGVIIIGVLVVSMIVIASKGRVEGEDFPDVIDFTKESDRIL